MGKRMLIVYYSVSNGNTKRIAEQLQETTGADMVRIDTVKPYSGCCNAIVEQGQREVNRGYQPELKPLSVNPADYDVIAADTPHMVVHDGSGSIDIFEIPQLEGKDRHSVSDPRRLAGAIIRNGEQEHKTP